MTCWGQQGTSFFVVVEVAIGTNQLPACRTLYKVTPTDVTVATATTGTEFDDIRHVSTEPEGMSLSSQLKTVRMMNLIAHMANSLVCLMSDLSVKSGNVCPKVLRLDAIRTDVSCTNGATGESIGVGKNKSTVAMAFALSAMVCLINAK